jgi:hypothetical protein
MYTIGELVSRVRNTVKAVKQDAGSMSDRYLYSLIMKHGRALMRRQDDYNRILRYNDVWRPIRYMELIEVDRAEAQCFCVESSCTFKRTKEKLPELLHGYYAPLIRMVGSLDQSEDVMPTNPSTYEKMSKQKSFKYNKTKYYWYLDGYLYFPNLDWDAIRLEGIFVGDISKYNCEEPDYCYSMYDVMCPIPEYLFTEIEQLIFSQDLGLMVKLPQDTQHDTKNIVE